MKKKNETFADIMLSASHHYDLRSVFDDLLTMCLCAVTHDPLTKESHYESLYMETIGKYKTSDFRFQFPKMLGQLIIEMEDRVDDSMGNDVLGEYFEQHLCRKNSGQFFTPFPICMLMSQSICGSGGDERPQRVIDPTCGSGRMLLAGAKSLGRHNEFYGIDIDHTCIKMAALNLFFNGIFHSEVMWADALRPDDFHIAYRISLLPFGIFRIEDKERSRLWQMYRHSFAQKQAKVSENGIILPSQSGDGSGSENGTQITLF